MSTRVASPHPPTGTLCSTPVALHPSARAAHVTTDQVVDDLLPLLRRFCAAPCGIALGGSLAKGAGDAHSDVDLYLFSDQVLPGEQRRALVMDALGADAQATSWGADHPWVQGGTDFLYGGRRVEVWLRSGSSVDETIRSALRGEIRRDPVVWTVMGFFSYAALADVHAMRIAQDAGGLLARWKASVATYPEPLRASILRRFAAEAAFWPGNPHYAGAVERGDVIYTSGIVQQTVHAVVQVVFALNRAYFPGEKRLAAALAALPAGPAELVPRIHALLWPAGEPGVDRLREQARALGTLVDDVRRMAAAEMPG